MIDIAYTGGISKSQMQKKSFLGRLSSIPNINLTSMVATTSEVGISYLSLTCWIYLTWGLFEPSVY